MRSTKLSLKTESVRVLVADELEEVGGGIKMSSRWEEFIKNVSSVFRGKTQQRHTPPLKPR